MKQVAHAFWCPKCGGATARQLRRFKDEAENVNDDIVWYVCQSATCKFGFIDPYATGKAVTLARVAACQQPKPAKRGG